MTKPLMIGITAGRQLMPAESGYSQNVVFGCPTPYCDEVERAGGTVMLLPPTENSGAAERIAEAINGLLLTGGGDVDPSFFNEEPHPQIESVDPIRDAMEIAIIRSARARGIPIFGICRGIQILNVAMGGGLLQHIDSARRGAVSHRQRSAVRSLWHSIDIEAGSLLERLMGRGPLRVNSYHHQAVGEVAPGLAVSARSRDGIIEAVEANDGAPVLGVQFHPERTAPDDPPSRALFEWLVREAVERQRT